MMRFLGTVVLPLALVIASAAQQPPPFTSHTDLIEVDAVVTDRAGEPIEALRRDDFTVEEDGHSVPISTFAEIDADRAISVGDGRFVVVLFDARFVRGRAIARMIVDRMGPHDVIAILTLSGSAAKTTTDKAEALEQLHQLERGVGRARSPAGLAAIRSGNGDPCGSCGQIGGNPDSPDASRVLMPADRVPLNLASTGSGGSVQVLETIADVAKQLSKVHRRKTLVYVGNGSALELSAAHAMSGIAGPWFDAVRSASRADVSVSVIDPNGTTGRPYDGARGFARETGGDAFVNRSDFQSAVDRLWSEAGHFYVLGYAPPQNAKKGRHMIHVRVDRSDAEVRARQTRE